MSISWRRVVTVFGPLAWFGLASGAGCAASNSEAAIGELRTRLAEVQRKDAESRRRVDDLENRVFLLTDQLESHKVAAVAREPHLPVVTLHPSNAADDHLGVTLGHDEPVAQSDVEVGDEEVQMIGDAREDSHRARPSLHGEGSDNGELASSDHAPAAPSARHHAREEAPIHLGNSTTEDSLGVASAPPIPKTKSAAVDPAFDQAPLTAYRTAYAELNAGHYDTAEAQLRAFLKRYPHHDYADNAQYWLGESFYARHRYEDAAVEFRATVAKYPVGNKAPDALLKLAYSLVALGHNTEARRVLAELPSTYPRSEAARLATLKLGELDAAANPKVEDSR